MSISQGKVLIVDDEPSIRRALRTTFGTLGFDIAEAVTGEQALPLLVAANFDAVLLDVNMPGMEGLRLAGKSAGNSLGSHRPYANGA